MLLNCLWVIAVCSDLINLLDVWIRTEDRGNIILEVSQLHVTYTWPSWQPRGGMSDHSWVCLCPLFQGMSAQFFFTVWALSSCDWKGEMALPWKYFRKTGSYKGRNHFIHSWERQSLLWIIILTYYRGILSYRRLMWSVGETASYSTFTLHHWPFTSDNTLLNSLFSLGKRSAQHPCGLTVDWFH